MKSYEEYMDSEIEYLSKIPIGWSEVKIKNLVNNKINHFIDGDWIESPYIIESGIKIIQTGNIGVGKYIRKGNRYISSDTFIKLNCTEILPNDILICRLAEPVGRACQAPNIFKKMITSVDVCRLVAKEIYSNRFIVYFMSMHKYLQSCIPPKIFKNLAT